MIDPRELEKRFMYHPPKDDATKERHEFVRNSCLDLAEALSDCMPESREASLAMTKLEEVMFWANAAVARNSESG